MRARSPSGEEGTQTLKPPSAMRRGTKAEDYDDEMRPERIKGAYVLLIRVGEPLVVETRARVFALKPGTYAYVGSGMGGLLQRVGRHLRGSKRRHWHIDFLRPEERAFAVLLIPSRERVEDRVALALTNSGAEPVPGFGASDSPLDTHLFMLRGGLDVSSIAGGPFVYWRRKVARQ